MKTSPRNGATIDRIYIHKNEGPKGVNAALNLVHYLQSIDGGYHVVVDNAMSVRAAADDVVVEGEGGDNTHALAVCLIGYSAQPWGDAYDWAQFERAAQQVAAWCKAYGIPIVHVAPGAPGQPPTQRGIALHADDHSPLSEGHTDPGTYFPIESFIARVSAILGPPPPNPAEIHKIVAWLDAMKVPAILGETSDKVATLNDWLIVNGGNPLLKGNAYGVRTQQAVAWYKAQWQLHDRDGKVAGYDFATALVSHAKL
jgi:hypothetical protein